MNALPIKESHSPFVRSEPTLEISEFMIVNTIKD